MTRLLRNAEDSSVYKHYQNKLIKQFARRQFPKRILRELCGLIHDRRLQVLYRSKRCRQIDRCLPFVTTYARYKPSLHDTFRKRWRNLYEDTAFYSLLPNALFTVYRNRKTLKSLLSAKRRNIDIQLYHPNLLSEIESKSKFMRFNCHPQCRNR